MKKRKVLAIALCAIMVLSTLTGCGKEKDVEVTADPAEAKTQAQFECGKKTYDSLNEASKICISMMDSIYNAWKFAIYDADDCSSYTILSEFADEVYLSESEITAAWNSYMGEMSSIFKVENYLDDFQYTVDIVLEAYKLNGKVDALDNALESAKTELKTMTADYADYSEYPSLKSYYSQVSSYAEFAKSPSGSFEQLKTTIEKYETEIRTYRSDLEFIFDE